MKKILSLLFALSLLFSTVYANEIYSYKEAIPVSEGITLYKVEEFHSTHNLTYSYIEADLSNENIGLTLLKSQRGMDYSETNAALALSEENVVASLNADFFSHVDDKTIALGIEIKDGKMLQSPINPDTMATISKTGDEILMGYLDFHIMAVAPNWEYEEIRHLNKHTSYYGDILMFTSDFNGGYSPAPGGEVVEVVIEEGIIKEFRRNLPPCEIPENGCVLAVSEGSSMFFSNNFEIGDEIKFDYYITPDISSADLAFGGGAMLVSDGVALKSFSHNITGYNPRSAIGISEDGKKLYLVAVNGRQGESRGMSMTELALLMKELGCHTAVNLDGGGSTTMLASTVWNESVHKVNSPSETRRVINAIGITYDGKENLVPSGIMLEAEKSEIFIGESVKILSAVYNKNLRPIDSEITWSSTSGKIKDGVFTADKGGKVTITAKSKKAKEKIEIFVVDEISGIVSDDKLKISVGESKALDISVFDNEGHFVKVGDLTPFSITSDNPSVISYEDGKIISKGNGSAVITIKKDDATAFISVISGEDKESITIDFNEEPGTFSSYPDYVKGDFYITEENSVSGDFSGALSYDFTEDTEDSKAAYLTFSAPYTLSAKAKEISLKAYSEEGFPHELRALLTDKDGKEVRIVLGSNLESEEVYTLTGEIPEGAKAPLTLKRIYALYQNEEEKDSGTIYIDDLTFERAIPLTYPEKPDNIYSDFANKDGDGEKLFIASLSGESDTLISRFLDKELSKEAEKNDLSLLIGKEDAFNKKESDNALLITLSTDKGGIRATSQPQWTSLKTAVSESDAPYLFIVSENPVSGSDEFENQVLRDYLASLEKEVCVIEKDDRNTLKIIDGVRYFTIKAPDSSLPLSRRLEDVTYLEFHLGEDMTYSRKFLYE